MRPSNRILLCSRARIMAGRVTRPQYCQSTRTKNLCRSWLYRIPAQARIDGWIWRKQERGKTCSQKIKCWESWALPHQKDEESNNKKTCFGEKYFIFLFIVLDYFAFLYYFMLWMLYDFLYNSIDSFLYNSNYLSVRLKLNIIILTVAKIWFQINSSNKQITILRTKKSFSQ